MGVGLSNLMLVPLVPGSSLYLYDNRGIQSVEEGSCAGNGIHYHHQVLPLASRISSTVCCCPGTLCAPHNPGIFPCIAGAISYSAARVRDHGTGCLCCFRNCEEACYGLLPRSPTSAATRV